MRPATRKVHSIGVKHNIEVAHRLFLLPGKCENIHGHSMWIELEMEGELNEGGILEGIEFGDLKKTFRGYLDQSYDHHVLLNKDDPYAMQLLVTETEWAEGRGNDFPRFVQGRLNPLMLPGLRAVPGDPTTENIAKWVHSDMKERLDVMGVMDSIASMEVTVWETSVNKAYYAEDYQ